MRRFSVSLLLFVASGFTFGQQAPKTSPGPEAVPPIATTFPSNASTVEGCPVGLTVDRRSNLVTRLAEDGRPAGPAQGLYIRLIHFGPAAIESAEITVHGVTSRASILPVGVAASASNEISKTFVLHPGEGRKGWQEATVWIERAGVLTSADLNSLTYADGSVWHESEGSRCYAVPSPFRLVGAK